MQGLHASLLSILQLFLLSTLALIGPKQARASEFYRCPNGYELQVKGQSVRCFKPEAYSYVRPRACPTKPQPERLIVDHRQLEDKCVGSFTENSTRFNSITNLQCPNGFNLEIRRGRDRCKRHIPAKIIPPSSK
jgi:hypothetical protein